MEVFLSGESLKVCRELGPLFAAASESLYLVGGAVRDRMLGAGSESDLDFTTSASPDGIKRIVKQAARVCYDKSGAKGYGTMGVRLRSGPEVEITPYRAAGGFGAAGGPAASLALDLEGRDFTINAMALDLSPGGFGALEDPFGGAADLEARILRTPRAPALTFEDDPLRLMRAARFVARFRLSVAPETLKTIRGMASARPSPLERSAPERIRDELLRALELDTPSAALRFMLDTGLLRIALPEAAALADMQPESDCHHKDVFSHTLAVVDTLRAGAGDDIMLLLAGLLHDCGKPAARRLEDGEYTFHEHAKTGAGLAAAAAERLRLSNAQAARLTRIVLLHHRLSDYSPEWTDAAVRRAVNELGNDMDALLALAGADITTSDATRAQARREALQGFRQRVEALDLEAVMRPVPPIDGNEVMRLLGLEKGGPEVGRAVSYLKELLIAGTLAPDDAAAAREIVLSGEWRTK